ncbi:hypothetical protein B0H16DRAFT_870330 [Mycena metata]|uniref:Uncharacterized protein n=1 Tax=Mycena metata TaxID=1033252 RepID=A0AAD7IUN7_9AGAR|nr:hypothetical protein B0H16DRAFT_870330 [Mycena metata]
MDAGASVMAFFALPQIIKGIIIYGKDFWDYTDDNKVFRVELDMLHLIITPLASLVERKLKRNPHDAFVKSIEASGLFHDSQLLKNTLDKIDRALKVSGGDGVLKGRMAAMWKRSLWAFCKKQEILEFLARAHRLLEAGQFALSGDLSDTIDVMARDLDDYHKVLVDKFEELKTDFQELKESNQNVHSELRDIGVNISAAHAGVNELMYIQHCISRNQIEFQTNARDSVQRLEEGMARDRLYDDDYRLFRKGDIHLRALRRQISVSPEGVVSAFDAQVDGQAAIVRFYRSHRDLHTVVNALKSLRDHRILHQLWGYSHPGSSENFAVLHAPSVQSSALAYLRHLPPLDRFKEILRISLEVVDANQYFSGAQVLLKYGRELGNLLIDNRGVPKLDCHDSRYYTDPLNPNFHIKKLAAILNFFCENGQQISTIADSVFLPACNMAAYRTFRDESEHDPPSLVQGHPGEALPQHQ